jgi:hypothetical protein
VEASRRFWQTFPARGARATTTSRANRAPAKSNEELRLDVTWRHLSAAAVRRRKGAAIAAFAELLASNRSKDEHKD